MQARSLWAVLSCAALVGQARGDANLGCGALTYCTVRVSSSEKVEKVVTQPGGPYIASVLPDSQRVRVRDTRDGSVLRTFAVDSTVEDIALSAGGVLAASRVTGAVLVGGISETELTETFNPAFPSVLAFSADGMLIAAGHSSMGPAATVTVWHPNGTAVTTLLMGVVGAVDTVAWSPDGKYLAAANSLANTVCVWRVGGAWDRTTAVYTRAAGVKFSADSAVLLVSSSLTVDVVAFSVTGLASTPAPLVAKGSAMAAVAWSPSGARVATADTADNTVSVWLGAGAGGSATEPTLALVGHDTPVTSIVFLGDSSLTSCSSDSVCISWSVPPLPTPAPVCRPADTVVVPCDLPGCKVHIRHAEAVRSVAVSPDGTAIAVGGASGTTRVFDAATGARTGDVACAGFPGYDVAFSPDGKRIAVGGGAGQVAVCDAASDALLLSLPAQSSLPVQRVSFSPDGKWLISAGSDEQLRRFGSDGAAVLVAPGHSRDAAFSPDGATVANVGTSVNSRIEMWGVESGLLQAQLPQVLGDVKSLAFSPDGTELLCAYTDGRVSVWRVETSGAPKDPQPKFTVRIPTPPLFDAVFSPDGTRIAAAGLQSSVLLSAVTGDVVDVFTGHSLAVSRVAFSPDSSSLVTVGGEGSLFVWSL